MVEQLGGILQKTTVQLRPQRATYLSSPEAMAAHTDHPWIDLILWECIVQDQIDGTQILVDGEAICAKLGSEADSLRSICLPIPGLHDLKPIGDHPILNKEGFYWAPWRRPPQLTKDQTVVFENFKRLTSEYYGSTRIRLKTGEMLLIDNRRMMHGRASLPTNSKRLLRRWWIKRY
jgi:hypothetical protein